MAIEPKTTREHIVALYGHISGVKKNINAAKILGVNTNRLQQEFKDRQLSPKHTEI